MTRNVKEELAAYAGDIEAFLAKCLDGRNIPERLRESMNYSLLAGGKRLRPALCLVWAEMLGLPREHAMPFACSLELIHSYSLVHDDLPAMDDDDLRRGKPSNHKVYGEATAILAGDGLLTEAFSLMFESARHIPAGQVLAAANLMSVAAGAGGMVGGQALDMEYTGKGEVEIDMLKAMHAMKTGALIRAACQTGAVLAGADEAAAEKARLYGTMIGAAFQIVDDILDIVGDQAELGKPVGSDEDMGKVTYPSLLGLEESRKLAQKYVERACNALDGFSGEQAEFLKRLARYIVDRAS